MERRRVPPALRRASLVPFDPSLDVFVDDKEQPLP
jgi:hypothetical protein